MLGLAYLHPGAQAGSRFAPGASWRSAPSMAGALQSSRARQRCREHQNPSDLASQHPGPASEACMHANCGSFSAACKTLHAHHATPITSCGRRCMQVSRRPPEEACTIAAWLWTCLSAHHRTPMERHLARFVHQQNCLCHSTASIANDDVVHDWHALGDTVLPMHA